MSGFYIKAWNGWSPGVESNDRWKEWASGKVELESSRDNPGLKHLPPMARRRLSQVTKMVLEVGHNLLEESDNPVVILSSEYGEIKQQYDISKGILETGEVKPASFSLSVFNAPISLLTIHEKITEPAIVILSGENGLYTGLLSAIAELESNYEKDVLLLFADELIPDDYKGLAKENKPFCFGLILSNKENGSEYFIEYSIRDGASDKKAPLDLLKWMVSNVSSSMTIGLDDRFVELKKC